MRALFPLLVMVAIILLHQRKRGSPSYLAYACAAYLLAVMFRLLPAPF